VIDVHDIFRIQVKVTLESGTYFKRNRFQLPNIKSTTCQRRSRKAGSAVSFRF